MTQVVPPLRFVTTQLATGPAIHYAEQGEDGGNPLILLHGWASSWFSFSRVLPLMPVGYHTLAIDQRGYGNSERPPSGYSIDDFADDVVAFMDALEIRQASLVGHSLGSFVARRVALTHPNRVVRLVLIGSAVDPGNEAVLKLREVFDTLPDPVPREFAERFLQGSVHLPLPEPFMSGVVDAAVQAALRVLRATLDGLLAMDDASDLGRISVPTLILSGEQHAFFGRAEQERLAAAIPGSRLMVYPETGTSPHWERPERVAADLDAFLEASSPIPRGSQHPC